MSEWIEKMAFSKYRVNVRTNEYQFINGWVKELGVSKPTKPKAKKVEVKTSVVEEEMI